MPSRRHQSQRRTQVRLNKKEKRTESPQQSRAKKVIQGADAMLKATRNGSYAAGGARRPCEAVSRRGDREKGTCGTDDAATLFRATTAGRNKGGASAGALRSIPRCELGTVTALAVRSGLMDTRHLGADSEKFRMTIAAGCPETLADAFIVGQVAMAVQPAMFRQQARPENRFAMWAMSAIANAP